MTVISGVAPSIVLPYFRRFKIIGINAQPFHSAILTAVIGPIIGLNILASLLGIFYNVLWARLSCFSNPTQLDPGIGTDFSCELLGRDQPSISFNVQSKETEDFDNILGRFIKKSMVQYWLTRLFPVYLVVHDAKEGMSD